MELTLNLVEYVSNEYIKGPIIINTDNYIELKGMSEDEIKEYISENYYEMKSINDYNDSLYDDLREQEVVYEKNTNDACDVIFDYEN